MDCNTSRAFTQFLREQGTERRLTTHDTPQHNGVAESLNRRLLERVRALLHHSSSPKTLWAEALHFMVWLKNRTSTQALGNRTTPFEKLTGTKPNLSGIPKWGQIIWVHSGTGSKLDARGLEAHWIGYDLDSPHAHRIYWKHKNSVSVERNVKFISPTSAITIHPEAPCIITASPGAPPALPPAPPPAPPTLVAPHVTHPQLAVPGSMPPAAPTLELPITAPLPPPVASAARAISSSS